MIKHVTGNLLDFTNWNVIAHCCNAQNQMGSGIAKAIRDEYPVAWEVYSEAYRLNGNKLELGSITAAVTAGGKRIINIVGQEFYGTKKESLRYVDYEAIYMGLEETRYILENALPPCDKGIKYTLGLPYKMASDRAGGNWKIILTMIEVLFKDSPINVYIVSLPNDK